jgi:hypothetical protein
MKQRSYHALFVMVLLTVFNLSAVAQTKFDFAATEERARHDQRLRDTVIRLALQQPLTNENERAWKGAFWAMELLNFKTTESRQSLSLAWRDVANRSEDFQKSLLEVSYTLYPSVFSKEAATLLSSTTSPAIFVRCAEYLRSSERYVPLIRTIRRTRFKDTDYPGFALLGRRLQTKSTRHSPTQNFFDTAFLPGQTVIYSLQRSNRNYPGLVLIRKPDGQLLRDIHGELFYVQQLARSVTNLPYYITNGNTPQGIFRWTGFDTATNKYIGPTTNLQMVMPYETTPAVFFNDSLLKKEWSKSLYASLLPAKSRNNEDLFESFYAGQIGRSEVIMHGTTINPLYYKGATYFPQTPSLGCLCSYEEWSADGTLIRSDQQRIVTALNSIGQHEGFVVVIDIDIKPSPVTLKDVSKLLPLTQKRAH